MKTSTLKLILFFLFIMLGHYWVNGQDVYRVVEKKKGKEIYVSSYAIDQRQKLEVVKYEEQRKKYFYSIEITGAAYVNADSIAMYLYEPLFISMILYDIKIENGVYVGRQYGRKKKIKVHVYENIIFVEYGKVKSKLYLK